MIIHYPDEPGYNEPQLLQTNPAGPIEFITPEFNCLSGVARLFCLRAKFKRYIAWRTTHFYGICYFWG